MTYDFRANQVRLNRIISSGSIPIIIYASSSATDLQGGKNFPDPGSDVFLFISGSSTAKTLFGGDVVVSGSLTASIVSASQLTGSLQNITTGVPYLVGGTNITLATSSIGQITITSTAASSGGGDVSASYVVMSPTGSLSNNQRVLTAGNGIRLTDSGSPSGSVTLSEAIWTEQTNIFATTTSSIGIKTTEEHTGVDLFISGSDTTGFGANLVLYSDLSNFGLPRLVLSSSSGSLGGLIGYDNDISGLVDGINIDIPSTRNFGFRIGGGTPATTVDSAGNLNVRSGSASTGYFDVVHTIVGIGTATPNAYNASATRLVIKDTDSTGNKYQLFLSNEEPSTDLNSGIAFAFGPSNISGAIYAKSNTTGDDRKGLNALIPTGNSFSWRTTGAHLGELTDSGSLIISGSVKAYTGFTGSLSGTIGGLPFIVGGPNITASYNSLGQWEITGSTGSNGTGSITPFFTGVPSSVDFAFSGSVLSASNGNHVHSPPDGLVTTDQTSFAENFWLITSGSASMPGNTPTGSFPGDGVARLIFGATAGYTVGGPSFGYASNDYFTGDISSRVERSLMAQGYKGAKLTVRARIASKTGGPYNQYGEVGAGIFLRNDDDSKNIHFYITSGSTNVITQGTSGSVVQSPLPSNPAFDGTTWLEMSIVNGTQVICSVIQNGVSTTVDSRIYSSFDVTKWGMFGICTNATPGYTVDFDYPQEQIKQLPTNIGLSLIEAATQLDARNIIGATSPSAGGLDKQIQFNSGSTFSGSSNLTYNYTTNTLTLTGSLTASTVVAGGVNITPVTASLFVYGDGTNRGSGSISGLFESGSLMTAGTIGKFDVEILAMSYGSQTGASWKYTATALWPSSGNFSFIAATELAAEYGPTAGSYNPAAEWDVNFNSLGQIELTGSAPALALPGGTSFYVQVTKKMVATYGTILA
jgi:hypothetical protein